MQGSLYGRIGAAHSSCHKGRSVMPLISMSKLLTDAMRGGYVVCYCEAWNLESFQAVVEAAEELRSPIIAGFNGGFLLSPERAKPPSLAYYAGMALSLGKASVPVAFLLNETDSFSQIEEAIALGFNAVMVENGRLSLEEYRRLVKKVVGIAHQGGLSVEAQVGRLADGSGHSVAEVTNPEIARAFVAETGIDALAVAVGNVHILTTGKAILDLRTLERVHDKVSVPLVLHGGTGIPLDMVQDCIRLGVAKVNFGTALKQAYLEAVRTKLAAYREPMSPHPFLGVGGEQDILVAGVEAVKLTVREFLHAFGSAGKAS
jgi:fructose-bisphosphate aldolase, class II